MPPGIQSKPRIAVILVNWRGSHDTIECLESLLRQTIPVKMIVCDNASGDEYIECIEQWARGLAPVIATNPELASLTTPPLPKPLDFVHLDPVAATHGSHAALTIIESDRNGGFASGCNIGLRCAIADPDIEIFWLLNNDTVVDADCAAAIVAAFDADQTIGIVGSEIRYYHDPCKRQLLNGMVFDHWTGTAAGIAAGTAFDTPFDKEDVIRRTDFVSGASLAVSRTFLVDVGLLDEGYFLYYEEIDWHTRCKNRYRTGFADNSIVWHKEGASAGSSGRKGQRSPLSEYHLARSKLRFALKHFPFRAPFYFLQNLVQAARRIIRRQPEKARAILRGSFGLPFG